MTSTDPAIAVLATIMTTGGTPISADELTEHLDDPYTDLALDSLAHLDLMSKLESRFGVRISDDQARELATPRKTLRFLETEAAQA